MPDSPPVELAGVHVLLLQEDASSRAVLGEALEQYGAHVTQACSEPEALRLLRQVTPDVIVRSTIESDEAEAGGLVVIGWTADPPATSRGDIYAYHTRPVEASALASSVDLLARQVREAREALRLAGKLRARLADQRARLADQRVAVARQRAGLAAARCLRRTPPPTERSAIDLGSNRLLAGLSDDAAHRLSSRLEVVELEAGQSLYLPGEQLSHVYFPQSAVVATVAIFDDGSTCEQRCVGHEGMLGVSACADRFDASHQALVIVSGRTLRMPAKELAREDAMLGELHRRICRYKGMLLDQAWRIAACNHVHLVEARLSRWLLSLHDRVRSDTLALTHERIAYVLGVRRAGITVAIGKLEAAGAVTIGRGALRILDRGRLEGCACECYQLFAGHFE